MVNSGYFALNSVRPEAAVQVTANDTKAALKISLPEDHAPYTDKYFLRSGEILNALDINPWVRAQVMIRKGPGTVAGIDEAVAIVRKFSELEAHGGTIRALPEHSGYAGGDTVMLMEGPIQDIIELETMYLGVISAKTTESTLGISRVDTNEVTEKMNAIRALVGNRQIIYMGARHWHWSEDRAISMAAFEGGANSCSTDIGASMVKKSGVGTIPHVLENIMAARYGKDRAVVEAVKAFDSVIDPAVPRVALIDYNNKEIDDSLACAAALGKRLWGVRVDTCGENLAQGALQSATDPKGLALLDAGLLIPDTDPDARYWYGKGVTVSGVYALRKALDEAGFADVNIVLSSGFSDPKKVGAFVRAEERLGIQLFETVGCGQLFQSRSAKMDIVAVGETADTMQAISKAGRSFKDNPWMVAV